MCSVSLWWKSLPQRFTKISGRRSVKQNLRIETFVGTSANALHIQVWTTLIAILTLRYLKLRSSFGWALSNLLALLRFNLFAYRDLWKWLAAFALAGLLLEMVVLAWPQWAVAARPEKPLPMEGRP